MTQKELTTKTIEIMEAVEANRQNKKTLFEGIEEKIHTFADMCRETNLYKNNEENSKKFIDGFSSAEQVYKHMTLKITQASYFILALASVVLCMPIISDLIKEGKYDR